MENVTVVNQDKSVFTLDYLNAKDFSSISALKVHKKQHTSVWVYNTR